MRKPHAGVATLSGWARDVFGPDCYNATGCVFDLDGVVIDSERLWNEAEEALVRDAGGRCREEAPAAMTGMSSPEWSAYLHDDLGVPMDVESIYRDVVRRMKGSTAACSRATRSR